MIPFRLRHLYALLETLYSSPISETQRVADYFKDHRSLGSKDRQWMSDRVFSVIRHKRLLEAVIQRNGALVTPQSLVSALDEGALDYLHSEEFAWPIRYSISDDLAEYLVRHYGENEAQRLAQVFLEEAPITIRVNTKKISVEDLQNKLPFPTFKGEVPTALHCEKREALQHTYAFRQGEFEVQDESSQKVSFSLPMTDQDLVLDFCAGAGGKSLIFAQRARHVVLYDTRAAVLEEAKKRLLRAGVRNFTIKSLQQLRLQSFSHVVVDAPCSSSGVFRRYIEKKTQFTQSLLHGYIRAQRNILRSASKYVKDGGMLSYITCSILPEENEYQIAYMKSLGLDLVHQMSIPLLSGKGDGFFACSLVRKHRPKIKSL